MYGSGRLIIRPVRASLTRDTDILTRMDPYCVISVRGHKQRTRTKHEAGKHPSWSETFAFRVVHQDTVHMTVWDRDYFSRDDVVGEGTVTVMNIASMPNMEQWIRLEHRGHHAGNICIVAEFIPDGMGNAFGTPVYQNFGYVQPPPIVPMNAYPSYPTCNCGGYQCLCSQQYYY